MGTGAAIIGDEHRPRGPSTHDHWLHVGASLRKTAEWLGHQERWCWWRPLDARPRDWEACHLSASTVHRWLARAGGRAQRRPAPTTH